MSIDRTHEPRPDREAREYREELAERRDLRADKGPAPDQLDYRQARELAIMRLVELVESNCEGAKLLSHAFDMSPPMWMQIASKMIADFHAVNGLWEPEWEALRKLKQG